MSLEPIRNNNNSVAVTSAKNNVSEADRNRLAWLNLSREKQDAKIKEWIDTNGKDGMYFADDSFICFIDIAKRSEFEAWVAGNQQVAVPKDEDVLRFLEIRNENNQADTSATIASQQAAIVENTPVETTGKKYSFGDYGYGMGTMNGDGDSRSYAYYNTSLNRNGDDFIELSFKCGNGGLLGSSSRDGLSLTATDGIFSVNTYGQAGISKSFGGIL
ncbi:MAG: hypothetical protein V1843_04510, partial [bacterium]